ncbi:MAG: BrnT family toxin [Leptospiraceae bacterium]|nr:BrnT family toxin [Leptospiraceae bacterium]
MKFEWDVKKYDKNIKKHDIDFIEASYIFGDKNILSFFDAAHSETEER